MLKFLFSSSSIRICRNAKLNNCFSTHRISPQVRNWNWNSYRLFSQKIQVYFGSQTGTSQSFANTLVEEGKGNGFDTTLIDLKEYAEQQFEDKKVLNVFVVSTYGEGEPTDNSKAFFQWLQSHPSILKDSTYAVGTKQFWIV